MMRSGFASVEQNICTNEEKQYYKGILNGTIHVVAGGAGASLSKFASLQTKWSTIFKDHDHGFVKLTAFDNSNLLFELLSTRRVGIYGLEYLRNWFMIILGLEYLVIYSLSNH